MPFSVDLTNKVALVTGATRGIGRAVALSLASAGARLAIVGRDLQRLKTVAEEIDLSAPAAKTLWQSLDVGKDADLESFIEQAERELGKIDLLINNAGIYATAPISSQSADQWRKILETNLTASMRAAKAVVNGMSDRGFGRIINISSISGKSGEPYGAAYSASKFGMIGLTQSLALEVAARGVTVNAVCPGWVDTEMAHGQLTDIEWCRLNQIEREQSLEIARLSVPQNRFIEPQEVAALVLFLCSEEARGITGQAINICGGLSLH